MQQAWGVCMVSVSAVIDQQDQLLTKRVFLNFLLVVTLNVVVLLIGQSAGLCTTQNHSREARWHTGHPWETAGWIVHLTQSMTWLWGGKLGDQAWGVCVVYGICWCTSHLG